MDVGAISVAAGQYHYSEGDVVGKGYSSVVYKGTDSITGDHVAIKVVDIRQLKDYLHRELLRNEVDCLKKLTHSDNVVRLLDVTSTATSTSIVMEFCERGDLSSFRKQSPTMRYPIPYSSDDEVVEVLKQLINGYKYLWKVGIVHRDLKPANIFVRGKHIKIADFGFATDASKCSMPFSYNIGSPSYMAPEALRRNEYSFYSDIWAIGVIAFELLYGKLPWKADNDLFLYQMLVNEPIKNLIDKERSVSEVIQDFIIGCCSPSLRARLRPEEVVNYDWSGRTVRKSVIVAGGLHQCMRDFRNKGNRGEHPEILSAMASGLASPRTNRSATKPSFSSEMKVVPPITSTRNLPFTSVMNTPSGTTVQQWIQPQPSGISQQENLVPKAYYKPSTQVQKTSNIEHVQSCIMAQLHYCRFINLVLADTQVQQSELFNALRWELLRRIYLLQLVANQRDNILQLDSFEYLVADASTFGTLRELICKYHGRYSLQYNPENSFITLATDPTELYKLLSSNIRLLVGDDYQLLLVDRLTTLLQLKQLERRTDYNRFGEDSKIDMLMERRAVPIDGNSLRFRLQMLGLCS